MAKTKNYYMHTLAGQPAMFQDDHIVYAGKAVTTPLATSLEQIRDEQSSNMVWCYDNAVAHNPGEYGYLRIPVKSLGKATR